MNAGKKDITETHVFLWMTHKVKKIQNVKNKLSGLGLQEVLG